MHKYIHDPEKISSWFSLFFFLSVAYPHACLCLPRRHCPGWGISMHSFFGPDTSMVCFGKAVGDGRGARQGRAVQREDGMCDLHVWKEMLNVWTREPLGFGCVWKLCDLSHCFCATQHSQSQQAKRHEHKK